MSILIKGMEMPSRGCNNCPFVNRKSYGEVCPFTKDIINREAEFGGFPLSCPLGELPLSHGRLIDADALFNEFYDRFTDNESWSIWAMEILVSAPTIINSEGEDITMEYFEAGGK